MALTTRPNKEAAWLAGILPQMFFAPLSITILIPGFFDGPYVLRPT